MNSKDTLKSEYGGLTTITYEKEGFSKEKHVDELIGLMRENLGDEFQDGRLEEILLSGHAITHTRGKQPPSRGDSSLGYGILNLGEPFSEVEEFYIGQGLSEDHATMVGIEIIQQQLELARLKGSRGVLFLPIGIDNSLYKGIFESSNVQSELESLRDVSQTPGVIRYSGRF